MTPRKKNSRSLNNHSNPTGDLYEKNINCDGCGAEYNLDLDKYGGKKIKCKKCQGVIVVPTTAEADDEFEVVEEAAPATTPVAATKSHVQSEWCREHRLAPAQGREPR